MRPRNVQPAAPGTRSRTAFPPTRGPRHPPQHPPPLPHPTTLPTEDHTPPAKEHCNGRFPATRQEASGSRLGSSDKRSIRLEFDSRFGRDEPSRSTATAEGNIREPFRRTIPADDNDANRAETINPADRLPQTWREVVSRLNSLGIRDYRLTAGTQPNEFHFNCFFSPQDNPRVTHRFEADADEPLKAVQIVLTQIDEWRNGR